MKLVFIAILTVVFMVAGCSQVPVRTSDNAYAVEEITAFTPVPVPVIENVSEALPNATKPISELNDSNLPKTERDVLGEIRNKCLSQGYIWVPKSDAAKYSSASIAIPCKANEVCVDATTLMEQMNETCVDPLSDKEAVFRATCLNAGFIFVQSDIAWEYGSKMDAPCTGSIVCYDAQGNVQAPQFTLNETCVDPKTSVDVRIEEFRTQCRRDGWILVPKEDSYMFDRRSHMADAWVSGKKLEFDKRMNDTCVDPSSDKESAFRKQCASQGYIFVPNGEAVQYQTKLYPPCTPPDYICTDSLSGVQISPITLDETCVDPKSKLG